MLNDDERRAIRNINSELLATTINNINSYEKQQRIGNILKFIGELPEASDRFDRGVRNLDVRVATAIMLESNPEHIEAFEEMIGTHRKYKEEQPEHSKAADNYLIKNFTEVVFNNAGHDAVETFKGIKEAISVSKNILENHSKGEQLTKESTMNLYAKEMGDSKHFPLEQIGVDVEKVNAILNSDSPAEQKYSMLLAHVYSSSTQHRLGPEQSKDTTVSFTDKVIKANLNYGFKDKESYDSKDVAEIKQVVQNIGTAAARNKEDEKAFSQELNKQFDPIIKDLKKGERNFLQKIGHAISKCLKKIFGTKKEPLAELISELDQKSKDTLKKIAKVTKENADLTKGSTTTSHSTPNNKKQESRMSR